MGHHRRGALSNKIPLNLCVKPPSDLGELELVCSAFGLMKARMRYGKKGSEFVRAVARLALSKWHTTLPAADAAHPIWQGD